ncbi:MAG: tryptophan 2,3-dioxygenase family protein [Myxococcota bacterium]
MADAPNYWDYLQLQTLLSLQSGLAGDDREVRPDELHFIITHQVFELWFKLALAELRHARDHLAAPEVPEEHVPYVVHHLRRVNSVLRLAVSTFEVMETLTPQDFLDFRDKLTPASGFQSFQLREIELLMGLSDEQRIRYGNTDPIEHIRKLATGERGEHVHNQLNRARSEQSLRKSLHLWLYRTPIQGSTPDNPRDAEVVQAFVAAYLASVAAHHDAQAERLIAVGVSGAEGVRARFAKNTESARRFLLGLDISDASDRAWRRRVRAGLLFIESYRELPLLAWPRLLVDTMVEFEEQMVLFRTRHARMVERIIGRRVGTGGSSGVDYLDETTRLRIFTDLWSVRTLMLPRTSLPPIQHADLYGFAEAYPTP